MNNKAMERKLRSREAIDLSKRKRTAEGFYILTAKDAKHLDDGTDFCDASTEAWIWSVGEHRETGQIFAAVEGVFYQNPAYICRWLR